MKDSLKWLLSKFPSFLDKSNGSNFYKSSSVINEAFKEFRQNLFNTHLSHRLDKRVLLWKEQSVENDYTINFFVNIPYLKMVNCYKNDTLIYSESYEYDDEVNTFIYSHDDSSENIIPSDKYHITVETWEEYVLAKGFPENDTPVGDIYDHDESLDHIGALYDIPRKRYTYKESTNYANTEPQYNNRLTEDDYHYMNRILGYISHMQDTPLPVLEVWKLFGIDLSKISLINRERYLCKMYSVTKHGGDNWEPYPWEHKDPMGCFWPEPVFFFVEVDNHSPVYGQSINFSFTFMNMFGEDKGKDYLIDVYLDGEQIATEVDPLSVYEFSTKDVDDSEPLTFKFIANPLDTRMDTLESDDIIITIKGCNSADWYVSENGSDKNIGDKDHPFRTVKKAVDSVEGSRNVIVLVEGTFWITQELLVDTPMSIISCRGATIRNDTNYDFFRILQECSLYLQGITLKHKCCYMYGFDDYFLNNNRAQNPVYLRINPDFMCKPKVNIGVGSLTEKIHAHRNLTVSGVLNNANNGDAISGEDIQLYEGTTLLETETTDSDGEYTINHRVDVIGQHGYKLNHEESEKYCMGDTEFSILVEAMPTILTATFDNEVLLDDELIIGYDLVDYYGDSVTVGTVKLLEDGNVVASVSPGTDIHYTPTSVGTHSYKLTWSHDETYVASESETSNVIVRRYITSLVLETDKSQYLPTENVQVTGTLTDELGNAIGNQSVKLYDGETLVYTGVTNSNGIVTYTGKFSLGKHTLQWRYNQSRKYDACNSNSYRIRVKESVVENINLFLYPDKKIGVTGTSVGLNVLALDQNGEPISTGFKLVDTYTGKCGEYPATSYTTGNDGWWTGTVSTQAIVECHGTYFQAVSTVDDDIYSNVVHVFDVASPLLNTVAEIYSGLSYFDKNTGSVPVSVLLLDEEDEPLPNESFSVKLVSDGNIVSSTNGTTDVRGESNVNVSIPASVRGDEITLRVVYTGRANAYNGSSDELTLPYMFSPTLTLSTNKSVYVVGESIIGSCVIKDEFNTLLASKSVKLCDGSTLVDTQVSDSSGEVEFNVNTLTAGQHTLHCEYAGTGLYHDAVSNNVNVNIKIITSLDIDVPLSLIYSDAFLITGTLTDIDSNGLNGKTVKLKVGNTVVDTGTTAKVDGVDGIVKFTQTPVHRGTHSFQLVFDGDSAYVDSSSSVVTREIGKETSVLSVSSPVNDASIYVDESLGISGSLVTNDNEKISGATVVVSENGSTLTTLTTGSNGAFTGSLTGLSAGTHSLRFEFVSDDYYTGSIVNRNVIVNNHSYSLSASVDRSALLVGDSVTITGVLLKDGNGYANQTVTIYDGTTSKGTCTTDSNGVYSKTVTGLTEGSHSLKAVTSNAESEVRTVNVYEDIVVATVTGNSITLGYTTTTQWLGTIGDVVIDWGDGSTNTVNNPTTALTHTYTDGEQSHSIVFLGTVTSLGNYCFADCSGLTSIIIPDSVTSLGNNCFYYCTGLTSVTIPDSVTSLGNNCFYYCTGLTSVTIPDSVTSLGRFCFSYCTGLTSVTIPDSVTSLGTHCFSYCTGLTSVTIPDSVTSLGEDCFRSCSALIDYQLYWETQPIQYNSQKMPVHTGTVFTIPHRTTSVYTDAGYPSNNLVERGETLTLTCDKPIIQKTETSTVTATLKQSGSPLTGKTLNYQVKHGNTVISSGTKTTDSNGEATITYTGSGVGDVDIVVSYGTLLQETYELEDCQFYDSLTSNSGHWSIPSDVTFGYNEYSSDGWKLGNASRYIKIPSGFYVTFPFKLSFVLNDRYSYSPTVHIGENYYIELDYNKIEIQGTKLPHTQINGAEYSFIVRSDSVEAYCNNNLVGTVNVSFDTTDNKLQVAIGNNRFFQMKDLKVKAL